MPPLSPSEARVVDPVLTNAARGYRHAMHCWPFLFPPVSVGQRAGRIITFGTEDFVKRDARRTPGSRRGRVGFGYAGGSFSLEQRAQDGVLPVETLQDARAVPGIPLGQITVRKTMAFISLQVEAEAADLATTASNYSAGNREALAANDRWDASTSKPAAKVESKKEQIASAIGLDPNIMIVGVEVHRALKNNGDVIDRLKYTQGLTGEQAPVVNEEKLAQYFDVDVYKVGRARARNTPNGAFSPLWGKVAVMAYVDVTPLASMGSPSFSYTYELEGYPVAAPAWFDNDVDSWIYPCTTESTPVIAGKDAGFLFTTVVD